MNPYHDSSLVDQIKREKEVWVGGGKEGKDKISITDPSKINHPEELTCALPFHEIIAHASDMPWKT